MSYILDALKKSQQQREQQPSPSILIPSPSPSLPKAYYLWGVVIILSIIVLFKVFSVSEAPVSIMPKQIIPVKKVPMPAIQVHQAPAIQAITNPIQPAATPRTTPLIQVKEKTIVLEEAEASKDTITKNTDYLKDLPTWDELPVSIRSTIPTIHIEAHIYDPKPSKRMVIINGSLTHQGQAIDDSLQLIEITSTGVTLRYQNTLFTLNTF